MIKTYKDLKVYCKSYDLAMEIFELTRKFPKEEVYSLTDQIRRATRSIPTNIAEGWAKRKYKDVFIRHLVDSLGSCEEIKVWIDFAKDCGHINDPTHKELMTSYDEVGAMLFSLIKNWQKF
ncbi:MAG: four helix bundle protein [bacterium]